MINNDAFLSALEEVDNAILAALPEPEECSFQFSECFEKKMRFVIRRGNHPVIYKALQRVACVLLVLLMLFSSVMVFSTDARAAVIGWIKKQYDIFYYYFFPAESETSEKVEYSLGWVPDGYFNLDSFETEGGTKIVYINDQSQILQFSYSYGSKTNPTFADGESHEYHQIQIGNDSADLYLSTAEGMSSAIVWINHRDNILFCISGMLESDELITIAKNVTQK